ncbi:hypothetical protein BSKO_07857 [Bryopsis sp. KO-2023]|nr:hypothetical protein BSKO_07857 [Bryopsis sp. KO-2023]
MSKVGKNGAASNRGKRKRSRCGREAGTTAAVRGAKYHCNYCNKDISGLVRIKCAVCTDFDLCLECFSVGVEVHPHQNTHGYRVVDDLSFPLFAPNWGADEELLLLEGVDMYGLGNWSSVAEHVGTKGKEECERHYYQIYLKSGVGPAPTPTNTPAHTAAGMHAETPPPKRYRLDSSAETMKSGKKMTQVSGEVSDQSGTPVPSGSGVKKGRRLEHDGQCQGDVEGESDKRNAVEEVGKGRRAAQKAGEKVGDDQEDVPGGNTYEVTGYNAKRDEFDPEYDNDAESCIADIEFNPADPEEIKEKKLRLLGIYNERLDERDVRREFVRERKLLNVKKQQVLEKRRPDELNELHAKMRVFARFLPQEEHEALVEGLYVEKKLREHIEILKEMRRKGHRTFSDAEAAERDTKTRRAIRSRYCVPRAKGASGQNKAGQNKPGSVLADWRVKRGVKLDITLLPGWEILSAKERELCVASRFVPAHYLALKDRLLREADKLGYFPRHDVKTFFRLEPTRALKVYDLILGSGWIRSSPAEPIAQETPTKGENGQDNEASAAMEVCVDSPTF